MALKGLLEVKNNLKKIVEETDKNIRLSSSKVANDLLDKSNIQTPLDTGALRESGKAYVNYEEVGSGSKEGKAVNKKEATVRNNNLRYTASVIYTEKYALKQHERLDFKHTYGNAKYLQKPFQENKNKYVDTIKEAVKKGISKGGK